MNLLILRQKTIYVYHGTGIICKTVFIDNNEM